MRLSYQSALHYIILRRSEKVWKSLGKVGMAVKAPWPVAEEEDKVLTRESAFLQSSLKIFRVQEGKAKKGWTKASVIVTDSYPQWKVDALLWMQEQYKAAGDTFPPSLMGDLKKWTASNISEKKLIKNVMQFVSFTKREVEDVGEMAMDVKLPFDQMSVLESSEAYLKAQLNLENLDFIKFDGDDAAAASVPERFQGSISPGKPSLWMR